MYSPIPGCLRAIARSIDLVEANSARYCWIGAVFSAAALAACMPTAALSERSMPTVETQEAHHFPQSDAGDVQQASQQTQHAHRHYAIYNQHGGQRRVLEAAPLLPLPFLQRNIPPTIRDHA